MMVECIWAFKSIRGMKEVLNNGVRIFFNVLNVHFRLPSPLLQILYGNPYSLFFLNIKIPHATALLIPLNYDAPATKVFQFISYHNKQNHPNENNF